MIFFSIITKLFILEASPNHINKTSRNAVSLTRKCVISCGLNFCLDCCRKWHKTFLTYSLQNRTKIPGLTLSVAIPEHPIYIFFILFYFLNGFSACASSADHTEWLFCFVWLNVHVNFHLKCRERHFERQWVLRSFRMSIKSFWGPSKKNVRDLIRIFYTHTSPPPLSPPPIRSNFSDVIHLLIHKHAHWLHPFSHPSPPPPHHSMRSHFTDSP